MSPADSSPDHAPADPVVLVAPALAVAGQPALVEPSFGERYRGVLTGLAMLLAGGGLLLAWKTEQRVAALEQELVKRQQDSAGQAVEAKSIAKEAQQSVLAVASKQALLEVRVAEVTVQRGQLEEVIQSLSRSRDENLVVDIEAAIRVALQQAAITGSAEPLVATLRQSDERLARYGQPRLEGVRRAVARDLDRVKAISVTDISTLTIKLDEAVRMVDDLPVLSEAMARVDASRSAGAGGAAGAVRPAAEAASGVLPGWSAAWAQTWDTVTERVWSEVRALVRVTRIAHPEAVLMAPEQTFFLKENLKLRLLNARLALLSRQFATAQSDLNDAGSYLERFFDRNSRRTVLAVDLVRQVAAQARQVGVPRPDDTLAALAAAAAGR